MRKESQRQNSWPARAFCLAGLWSLAFCLWLWALCLDGSFAAAPRPSADARVQQVCAQQMQGRNGTIIVMDPRTGRLRAVVNPSIAFGGAYPAGSTIKIFTALAALEAGVIERSQRVRCQGKYQFEDFAIHCAHAKDDRNMELTQALAYSCNYYFATLGERLDAAMFRRYLAELGFGRRTGVDFENESAGRLRVEHERSMGRAAIGESPHILVTPVQLITAFAALINGGRLFRPYTNQRAAAALRLLPFGRHFKIINEALEGGALFGTGARAAVKGIELLGKTGTPTVIARADQTHAWFIGAAPREDPEIAVLVFIGRGRGGRDSAPVAAKVFTAHFEGDAR